MNLFFVSSSIIIIVATILCLFSTVAAQQQQPPLLPLSNVCNSVKHIQGVWMTVTNNQTKESRRVASFRGIRFGEKPVRFAGPVAYDICSSKDSIIDATKFSPACTQLGDNNNIIGSEDCLFLNIYISETVLNKMQNNQSASAATFPVNHYIFGGSLLSGNAADENHAYFSAFCGDSEKDLFGCVCLTTNYRLSILGFLAAPSFGTDVNFGIQDMILSLQWTQKFIGVFGGDKTSVTISGQSSGGTACYALYSSAKTRGLFRAAFSMSGSPNITQDRPSKILQDYQVIKKLGCASSSSSSLSDERQCLMNTPVEKLFNIWNEFPIDTPGTWSYNGLEPSGRHFFGLVFVDGNIVTMPFKDAVRSGLNANVTLVMQTEGQESNLVTPDTNVVNYTQLEWKRFLQEKFVKWGNPTSVKMASEFYNLYEPESIVNPQLAYSSCNADWGITCPSPDIARQISFRRRDSRGSIIDEPMPRAPIYISVNQWPPQNPDNFGIWSMCYHLWDYFAATQQWTGYTPTTKDYELSFLLRAAWYKLMKTGKMDGLNPQWLPVDKGDGVEGYFPGEYNTFVYSRKDRFPFKDAGMMKSYKSKICEAFFSFGINENFWWCN